MATWVRAYYQTAGRDGRKVEFIVPHISEGDSMKSLDNTFTSGGRQASAHYGIEGTTVHQYVAEGDTAWAVGNWDANTRSISIEHVGTTSRPPSRETLDTSAALMVEIAKRHGLGKLELGRNVRLHKEFYSTSCPASLDVDYLMGKVEELQSPKDESHKYVQLWTSNGADSQKFILHKFKEGTIGLKVVKSGKYLDVQGSEYKPGTPVLAWPSTGNDNQRFIIKEHEGGLVSIHPKMAQELCLDVSGGEGNDRDRINLWTFRGQRNQLWHRCPNADGTYTFLTSLDRKAALDVINGGVPSGA